MTRSATGLMSDLDEWQRWERGRRRAMNLARSAKQRIRPSALETAVLHTPAGVIRTLVVIEKFTPSCRAAIVEPLCHLDPTATAVLTPQGGDVSDLMPSLSPVPWTGAEQLGADVAAVLSLGAYLGLSGPVEAWARTKGIPFYLVQHGLLTPSSPPASSSAHVLAWSEEDAEYWAHGRNDLTVSVTGSQMLWDAGRLPKAEVTSDRPVMLGQLHGTELSRAEVLRTYWKGCRGEGMDYRPHPNEKDVVSRGVHAAMRRSGIVFDTRDVPLADLGRPVVSIFSTGTLEAAMRGLPAWVMDPSPSPWVRDFWTRYRLNEWGDAPTPAWQMHSEAPALAVARIAEGA